MRLLIAALLMWASAGFGEKYVQKNDGLIPGLYQVKTGQKVKGYAIALLEVGTLGGGIYYHLDGTSTVESPEADRLHAQYLRASTPEEADRLYIAVLNDLKVIRF